jgi:hypothetical protein
MKASEVFGTTFIISIAGAAIIGTVLAVSNHSQLTITRKRDPQPVAFAKRIIVEWPDGQIHLVRFALMDNGDVQWMEPEPNPDRKEAWKAQQAKRKAHAALEAERRALEEAKRKLEAMPKMPLSETNINMSKKPMAWQDMKNL